MTLNSPKSAIIRIAKQLHQKNMLAGADGNISVRLPNQQILITASGKAKHALSADDFALISLDNETISGHPSSEKLMHTTVYTLCPKARVIIHAHPPTAIAWTIAHPESKALPSDCMSELILATGGIPIADYARPGTAAMGEVLKTYLPQFRAIILARHGALVWGESFDEVLNGIERVEHSADILLRATLFGGLSHLPAAETENLYHLREIIGEKLL